MDWINAIRKAVAYIEAHLFEDIDSDKIAHSVNFSSFHFQRIFSVVTGVSIAEYIRNRRLSLAGGEMVSGGIKVINAAFKYGYESPESFAKAFQRFHGIPPSAACKNAANLRFFNPISIQVNIKGGFDMSNVNSTILEKLTFKPFGPYRFIGKSVCAAPGSGEIFGALWGQWDKINETLESMKEYSVEEEPHGIAYMDGKGIEEYGHQKMWYIVGRFMKSDSPVPNGYDFRDIPAMYVGEGHIQGEFIDMIFTQHQLTQDAICAQNEYIFGLPAFSAEVYLPETDSDNGGVTSMKYYISCEPNPEKDDHQRELLQK